MNRAVVFGLLEIHSLLLVLPPKIGRCLVRDFPKISLTDKFLRPRDTRTRIRGRLVECALAWDTPGQPSLLDFRRIKAGHGLFGASFAKNQKETVPSQSWAAKP